MTLKQIAADFGVHPMTLSKWLRHARIDDGERPGVSREQLAQTRELRKRVRLLEQENEVLLQCRRRSKAGPMRRSETRPPCVDFLAGRFLGLDAWQGLDAPVA